jgi:hypothetical protein
MKLHSRVYIYIYVEDEVVVGPIGAKNPKVYSELQKNLKTTK